MPSGLRLSTVINHPDRVVTHPEGNAVDKLLTIDEVAERLRKPVATLRYWRHIGAGPSSAKFGRDVRYREADVQAWIDKQFADARDSA